MRKKSRYRPRPVNPLAHLNALQGATRLTKDDQLRFAGQLRMAVDSIARGHGEMRDWQQLVSVINVLEALQRLRVIRDAQEFIERLQATACAAMDRQEATGSRALYAAEREALHDLAGLYAEVLDVVTHSELFQARERVAGTYERLGLRAGEALHA